MNMPSTGSESSPAQLDGIEGDTAEMADVVRRHWQPIPDGIGESLIDYGSLVHFEKLEIKTESAKQSHRTTLLLPQGWCARELLDTFCQW